MADQRGPPADRGPSRSESLGRLGALMAVDGEGVLRGVVTRRAGAPGASVGVRAGHQSVAPGRPGGRDRPRSTGLDAADFAPK